MGEKKVKIPEDSLPIGVYGQVAATFYSETLEGLKKKVDDYFRDFHPAGYGTYISQPIASHPDGYWWCKVSRWSSCD
jgi:hypothetical protein